MSENILRVVNDYSGLFIQGIGYTLLLAAIAVTCGTILGTLVALMKMSSQKVVSFFGAAYIELFRNTPLLLQLYIFMFLLPEIGINLSAFSAVSVGLVLNASNEAAVHLFLTKKISFLQIEQIIWNELQNKEYERSYIPSLEERISVGNCIYAKIIKEYGEII